ncbi:putative transmembrane protein [Apostichopus japonicus]|uniref:Putative transmembrane protein n=1 Tax=Stichopus japonicus TaxID=307972 RepID=A0A2G8KA76_STIJA|nr:putative transmembrane protein [Apostichopus japonicus]
MAGCSRSDPTGLAQMWLTLALSILQIIPTQLDKAEAQTPDIVQNELMQLMEEVAIKNEFASQGFHIETEKDHLGIPTQVRISPLKPWQGELNFDPPLLDFGEVPIGMPQIATVRVFNPQQQSSLRMVSISGTTPHFHCSFFQEKAIPAGGNTTFEIVFLPRLPGNVENTIFIHSNKGSAPYQVFGIGVPNPYRLRPILGARVPLNTSFSPLINMHNPYSSGLMITEMYSSGGDLHLELPTGSQEAPQNLWSGEQPYSFHSNKNKSFGHARVEGGEFLMLPVEVEVSSAPGLYTSLELIDFGTLRSLDEPKTIQLYLLNTSPKVMQITSVSLVRTNQAITIDFKPVELSSTQKHKNVANITFHPLKANCSRFWSGKIIVKTKDKNVKMQIPYQAHVLPGTLSVIKNSTYFHLLDSPPQRQAEERKLHLTNYFNFSIVIHQASLVNNAQGTFEIKNFSSPIVIPPHETDSSLSLAFTPSDTLTSLSTMLRLGTNASLFTIPVHAYTGKLKFFMYGQEIQDKINLGTAGLQDSRVVMMLAVNDNPVEVPVTVMRCTLPDCEVVIVEVKEGNTTYLGDEFLEADYPPVRYSRITIPAHHYALMLLRLKTPEDEGLYSGVVHLETQYHIEQYEAILKAVEGYVTIKPEKVVFVSAYPGLVQTQSITLHNSFSHKMTVESLKSQPPDEQFYFKPPKKSVSLEIEASKKLKIGKIAFDVRKRCQADCYVGLPTNTQDGQMWLASLKSDDNQEVDRLFYNFRRNKWMELQEAGQVQVNTTMRLATNLVRDVPISVSAELTWPKLTSKDIVKFPMTLVDSGAKSIVTIMNPTESTILLQLVPITAYKEPSAILDLFSDRFNPESIDLKDPNPFSVKDIGRKDCRGNCVKSHLATIEDTFGVKPDPSFVAMSLKPKQNATVHLNFRPYDNKERVSLFVIRNNLSVVDGFLVQGMGAKAELKLNSKLPGANSNIVFDMKVQHLNDCNRSSPTARTPPHFTVKRTLNLKNTGQIALHVNSWYINGQQCEGYGFRVLQCEPLFVQPNSTARLDITFCPDFSLARVVRTLQIQLANKEILEYNLIASLPHHLLSMCAAAVPRPAWEYPMYFVVAAVMCFFLVVICMVAYLEAVHFMEPLPAQTASDNSTPDGQTWKKLDLRSIGDTGRGKSGPSGSGEGGGAAADNNKKQKTR